MPAWLPENGNGEMATNKEWCVSAAYWCGQDRNRAKSDFCAERADTGDRTDFRAGSAMEERTGGEAGHRSRHVQWRSTYNEAYNCIHIRYRVFTC